MLRSRNRHAYRNYWSKIEKAKKRAEARRKWEAESATALRTARRPRKKRVALSQTKQQSQAKLKRSRLPLQRNGRNFEKLNSVLPQAVRDAIDTQHLPGPIVWGSFGRPIVAGPLSRRGGRFVIVDGFLSRRRKAGSKAFGGVSWHDRTPDFQIERLGICEFLALTVCRRSSRDQLALGLPRKKKPERPKTDLAGLSG